MSDPVYVLGFSVAMETEGASVAMVTNDFIDSRFFHISYRSYTKQTTLSRLVTSAEAESIGIIEFLNIFGKILRFFENSS